MYTVPAYTTYTERDYEYLIKDCQPSVIIVSDKFQFEKIKNLIIKNDFIKKVISFEKITDDKIDVLNIKEIFQEENYQEKNLNDTNLTRKDIACIIYTSGTQGNQKE